MISGFSKDDEAAFSDDPVYVAYKLYTDGGMKRESWDLSAVHFAIEGTSTGFYRLSEPCRMEIADDGSDIFYDDPDGRCRRMIFNVPEKQIADYYSDLLHIKPRPAPPKFAVSSDFTGGNIKVDRVEGDTVYISNELRDTDGDWFYWAFRVDGTAGLTLNFRFSTANRVGRFGPAVSRDLPGTKPAPPEAFVTFGREENRLFATICSTIRRGSGNSARKKLENPLTEKGRALPCVRFGDGDRVILLTARHHACESTGDYVLEGVIDGLLDDMPRGCSVLAIPFVDLDGVIDGDQGKNRRPHDHNRDYTSSPIYESIRRIISFADENDVRYTFDFHSPWHMGGDNDYVFVSRSTAAMEIQNDRFSGFLMNAAKDKRLTYDVKHDVGPNDKWNDETSPNSKNYFSKHNGTKLSITLETPYFGLSGSVISQDAMIELGRCFAKAVKKYIDEDN